MGNCQAVDAAVLAIQHPNGKLERVYWPVKASEVMKANPGYHVSLIIPLQASSDNDDGDGRLINSSDKKTTVRLFTRVKLLGPNDTLVLGRAYRLVTTQEVMRVVRAKKNAKMTREKSQTNSSNNQEVSRTPKTEIGKPPMQENNQQGKRSDRQGQRRVTNKSWNPSLQSISECEIIC